MTNIIRLTPKQGLVVADLVSEAAADSQTVEIESFKSSRDINVVAGSKVYNVGGKGKVTTVA